MKQQEKAKVLIICGPTATGKTKLALQLAKKFDGEIVSADSRQVYRGMNVGTGKDLPLISNIKYPAFAEASAGKQNSNFQIGYYEIDGVKVWLLDIVEPDYRFNVADYKKCADLVINDILEREKLPIIVGGTGFYIKAITDEIETIGVEPDWELRKILSEKDTKILSAELKELDQNKWEGMNGSDRQNPRRLIRAIEVATKTQISKLKSQNQISNLKTNNLFVGLKAPFSTLYQRIDRRVEERMKAGLEDEISDLLKKGYNWDNSALGATLAYSEWKEYFENKSTKEQVIQKWKFDEHNYARRQMTWFRKNKNINWFGINRDNWYDGVEKLMENWYS